MKAQLVTNRKDDPLKVIKKDKVFIPKSNIWIASATLSSLLFAASNFLLSVNSHNISMTREFSYVGIFIFTILYIVYSKIYEAVEHSDSPKKSIFYDKSTNRVNFMILGGVLLSTAFQICSGYSVLFAMEYSQGANINKGVITTFFAFTSVLMAIYSWFMFNEKLSGYNIFGILGMIVCISMLGFSDNFSLSDTSYYPKVEAGPPFYAIGFGMISGIFFSLRIIMNKGMVLKFKLNSSDLNVSSQFVCGTIFTIKVLFKYNIFEIDYIYAYLGMLSGVTYGLAILLIYHSYSIGYVAPATALSALSPIPLTIASSIHSSQFPSNYQIGGMLIGVFGGIVVSVGPFISERLSKNKNH